MKIYDMRLHLPGLTFVTTSSRFANSKLLVQVKGCCMKGNYLAVSHYSDLKYPLHITIGCRRLTSGRILIQFTATHTKKLIFFSGERMNKLWQQLLLLKEEISSAHMLFCLLNVHSITQIRNKSKFNDFYWLSVTKK